MQTIGSLTKSIVPTDETSGSLTKKSTPLPANSSAIGSAGTPSKAVSAPTGTRRGAIALTPSPSVSLPAALAGDSPRDTDQALEMSLTRLLGRKPVPLERTTFTDAGMDSVLEGYSLPAMTPEQRENALIEVAKSLSPMRQTDCIGMLGELKLLTACRPEQQHDLEIQLTLYARMLQEFPADVVRHVLKTQPKISKWWPTWQELNDRLELHTAKRKALMRALKTSNRSPTSSAAVREKPEPMECYEAPPPLEPLSAVVLTDDDLEARKRQFLEQCESA